MLRITHYGTDTRGSGCRSSWAAHATSDSAALWGLVVSTAHLTGHVGDCMQPLQRCQAARIAAIGPVLILRTREHLEVWVTALHVGQTLCLPMAACISHQLCMTAFQKMRALSMA